MVFILLPSDTCNTSQHFRYHNGFNKRAPEILAQLSGEFDVAMGTAFVNAIFPKIAFGTYVV